MGAPMLQRAMEKKDIVMLGFVLLIGNWVVLQTLLLTGVYAPVGDAALLPIQINAFVAGIGVGLGSVA
jgi:hypothetical protein